MHGNVYEWCARLVLAFLRERTRQQSDRSRQGEHPCGARDILGDEDHLGDMDFKVAGHRGGVTCLQMDIKIAGITEEIMKVALAQAKERPLAYPWRNVESTDRRARRTRRIRPAHGLIKIPVDEDP